MAHASILLPALHHKENGMKASLILLQSFDFAVSRSSLFSSLLRIFPLGFLGISEVNMTPPRRCFIGET